VDSQDDEGNPIEIGVTVAQLLVHELQHDNIVLDNLLYNSIYNEYVEHLERESIPDYNYFIGHGNSAISSLTIDLISSPYNLSNWEQHSIYITREEDILKKSILSAVYALKSRRLEIMIHDIQKRLKENPEEEEMIQLMQTQHQLLEAKKEFNALLGRTILK
jgi:DNA primase